VRIPRSDARAVIFSTLTFQGVLTVEDPAQFLAAVLRGFGAAKGFGCGLMLIRRAGP
jgi:CRISPR system Cascade subunit CasE